jgi:hypothetical protein
MIIDAIDEKNAKPQETADDKDEKVSTVTAESDWFLRVLVRSVNSIGGKGGSFGFGITLSIGGSLVSGDLISGREYFETFAADFANGAERSGFPELGATLKKSFSQFGEMYKPEPDDDGEARSRGPGYIHLKNARVHHGERRIPWERGVLFRARLSAVDGFILGSLT